MGHAVAVIDILHSKAVEQSGFLQLRRKALKAASPLKMISRRKVVLGVHRLHPCIQGHSSTYVYAY